VGKESQRSASNAGFEKQSKLKKGIMTNVNTKN
jgi:hypothetical protein